MAGEEDKDSKKDREQMIGWWKSALKNSQEYVGILVAPVLLGAAAGWWLDKKFSSDSVFFLVCTFSGFVMSIAGLYKKIKK